MYQVCEFYHWFFIDLFMKHSGVYMMAIVVLAFIAQGGVNELNKFRRDLNYRPDFLIHFKRPLPAKLKYKHKTLLILTIILMVMPILIGSLGDIMCGK